MNHLVSVIIPCYNTATLVSETLDSVLQQTYQDIEIIIVNDGSTDNLEDVINPYLQKHSNFKYLSQENGGLSNARNSGAKLATGKYFVFLDSDDLIAPAYIEKCLNAIELHPNVKVVNSNGWLFGRIKKTKYKYPQYNFRLLLLENIISPRALMRSADFFEVGMYDEGLRSAEDWNLWINMLKDGGDVVLLPDLLFYYRKRDDYSALTDFMDANKLADRAFRQRVYDNNESVYKREFGTAIDMLDLIRDQNRTIERYNRKKNKWYRRLFRF